MKVVISASNQTSVSKKQRKNVDQLIREREKHIKELVKPLARKPDELYIERETTPSSHTIAIRDAIKYPSGYRYQRFNTIVSGIVAGYFEIWRKSIQESDNSEFYYLDRAYLHFYIIDKNVNNEQEFFLLHCDPNEPAGKHSIYKQSLHLHIECKEAKHPHGVWPRCHIALNVGMVDQVLKDIDSFTEALKATIEMLKNQVFESSYWSP